MRVLITHPGPSGKGGVSQYYRNVGGRFTVFVEHITVGSTSDESLVLRPFRMLADYRRFDQCLRRHDIEVVHVNPSLNFKSFLRDGVFASLARAHKKRVVIFFHGWDKSFEARIERGFLWAFRLLFGKSDAFIVLCDDFGKTLRRWGILQPIHRETTVVDDSVLVGFNMPDTLERRQRSERWRVLFLSRVLREKGIYETIDAVSLVQARHPAIELVVAGDGSEFDRARSYVNDRSIPNISFVGYVDGDAKWRLLEESHLFCLPSYSEGMPTVVIEAMAFGLPVVTRPVGGLADFFKDNVHGFISDSLDPTVFANLLEKLFVDTELYERISLHNYQYAKLHFLASGAAMRLEQIYRSLAGEY